MNFFYYILFILVMSFGAQAQSDTTTASDFIISVNVTPAVCMKTKSISPGQYSLGIDLGVDFKYLINNSIAVKSGFYYSHKGFDNNIIDAPAPFYREYKSYIDYFEIPVVFELSNISDKRVTASIFVGGLPQFMLKYYYIDKVNPDQSYVYSGKSLSDHNFRVFNIGLITGLGINYELNNKVRLGIDALYKMSFMNFRTIDIHDGYGSCYHYSVGINTRVSFLL
ncbi:MAG: hypothetical protein C0592_08210 [Marinilabiliales bacterium]|nr:MAG: hypothetical protein C0592_08210 [Marinilabiliales bacterium]